MERLIINGANRLIGEMRVHGAKNSALPILAASLIADGVSAIHNCPELTDIAAAVKILKHLGCKVENREGAVTIDSSSASGWNIPDELMREMRSSVIFLGSVLSRTGRAEISTPGGCEIGLRPIDLHISAMEQLGARVTEEHGRVFIDAPNGLCGNKIALSFPSVGATENIILAAVKAKGTTTIINAAREPEISDLADFLNGCGAKIRGAGEGTVIIEGVKKLCGAEHTVIPDRITAATYMCCAAVTNGKIAVKNIIPAHLGPVLPVFEEMGCDISVNGDSLVISAPTRLRRIKTVRTMPYPGFPTDAQAPLMAAASVASGTSVFIENIFESRYKHISELIRLGAKIKVEDKVAVVEGVSELSGAGLVSPDLRGGAALVIAALCAKGESEISQIHHIDRGYESIEKNLSLVGADIKRKE